MNNNATNGPLWVNPTDISAVSVCEGMVRVLGDDAQTLPQTTRSIQGEVLHKEVSEAVVRSQGKRDERCFIASYAYGVDHPKTEAMRDFRDTEILSRPGGRWLVSAYYRLSPTLVRLCQKNQWFSRIVVAILDMTVDRIRGICK
jgi:hypothetical protein